MTFNRGGGAGDGDGDGEESSIPSKTCLADKSWRIEEQTGEQTSGKEGKNKNEVEL